MKRALLLSLVITLMFLLLGCPSVDKPPFVMKVSGPSETTSQGNSTFSWNGSAFDGQIAEYEYRKDGGNWTSHGVSTSCTWVGYSEGDHIFEVRAKDNKGAYSNVISWIFTYVKNPVALGEIVFVKGGTFVMGDELGDLWSGCRPIHQVTLTYDFWLGKYEVTFDEYDTFCEETNRKKIDEPGLERGINPVGLVFWRDATDYCNWLSEKERLPKAYDNEGNLLDADGDVTTDITKVVGYRLPTEAEWEYAARGGNKSKGYKYSGSDNANDVAWYWRNSGNSYLTGDWDLSKIIINKCRSHEVGGQLPNELGIYDMCGNVYEWCSDWYSDYSSASQTNPYNGSVSPFKVIRGGCWFNAEEDVRVANRYYCSTYIAMSGFRIAKTAF